MIETIVSEVLHRLAKVLPVEQQKDLQTTLYVVLGKYEITEKSTDLRINDVTWVDDLQRFIERKRISGKSERTLEQYQYQLTRILSYINKPIDKVTEGDLNEYLEKYKLIRKVSNVYLDGIRLIMSSFFGWQHKKGFIPKNPAAGVDPIKVEKRIKKAYSDEELEKIRRKCESIRNLAIVEFLYATGVRISEMCALNRTDVRINEKEIIVFGKGAKEREVFLTPISCMYLKAYLAEREDENEALFVSTKGKHERLRPSGVQAMLRKIGKSLGIEKCHPHRFRRTLATNLLRKGMPLQEVQVVLGHAKIETTLIYCTVDKDGVKADHRKYMAA
jgi:site-specific recombinase XerD